MSGRDGRRRAYPAAWLLALALRAHSRGFRERHGGEIEAHFTDAWQAMPSHGIGARIGFAARLFAVTVLDGVRERFTRKETHPTSSARSTSREGRDAFRTDALYAWRALRRRPAFAAVVIATLALGLGANAAVFALIDGVILKPLAYHEPQRLVRLYLTTRDSPGSLQYLTEPALVHLREHARTLDIAGLYTYDVTGADLTDGDRPERIRVLPVTSGYFEVLGAGPMLGRAFTAVEERDSAAVVVLSEDLWRRYLGGTPDALGRSITIDGVSATVIGVMAESYTDPLVPDVQAWLPQPLRTGGFPGWEWDNHWLSAVARLRPGVTIAQAEAELDRLSMMQGEIEADASHAIGRVVPLQDDVVGGTRTLLWVLMGAVGVLLLITCVNVAGLFVARGAGREQELAVRSAIGSSRTRMVRQLVLESVLLALAGGIAGLLLALLIRSGFAAVAPAELFPLGVPETNTRILGLGLFAALVVGLVTGVWPALRAARPEIALTIREGGRGASDGRSTLRARSVLVTLQLSLALVLLVAAGVLVRSFERLRAVDLGVRVEDVWTFEVHLPESRYADPGARTRMYDELSRRLSALPGVRSAGAVTHLPATGRFLSWGVFRWTDGERDRERRASANQRIIEGDYFEAAAIPLIRGRTFTRDDAAEAAPRIVISEAVARRLFPVEDPIGQLLWVGSEAREIVGIVGDVAITARGDSDPMIYHAHRQFAGDRAWSLKQVVRLDRVDPGFIDRARRELASLDPLLVLHEPRTLADVAGQGVATDRFAASLVTAFSVLALLLAALGIYGVLAYSVRRRRREIGIRMALGARAAEVRRMVVTQGMRLTALGIVAGLIGAFVAVRALESIVFGISPRDPATFVVAAVLLAGVALMACWIPALAATRVQPTQVLGRE